MSCKRADKNLFLHTTSATWSKVMPEMKKNPMRQETLALFYLILQPKIPQKQKWQNLLSNKDYSHA